MNGATPTEDMLGRPVEDRVSGFAGTALAVVRYLSGCVQVLVQPRCGADGKMPESQWFDIQRLARTNGETIILNNERTPGFDKPAPRR